MDTPFIFEGPITRTVMDAALAMSALAGYDARDPYALDETLDFPGAMNRDIKALRLPILRISMFFLSNQDSRHCWDCSARIRGGGCTS